MTNYKITVAYDEQPAHATFTYADELQAHTEFSFKLIGKYRDRIKLSNNEVKKLQIFTMLN